jgi:hypothetical protein
MRATCSWNPILREQAMELEWMTVVENINRLNQVCDTHMNVSDLSHYSVE